MTKDQFHAKYLRVLRSIARKMGYTAKTADVRSNKGGPAVLGEVMLHTDTFYVCVGGSFWDSVSSPETAKFYFRSCKGRDDYVGGSNHSMLLSTLTENPEEAMTAFQRVAVVVDAPVIDVLVKDPGGPDEIIVGVCFSSTGFGSIAYVRYAGLEEEFGDLNAYPFPVDEDAVIAEARQSLK